MFFAAKIPGEGYHKHRLAAPLPLRAQGPIC